MNKARSLLEQLSKLIPYSPEEVESAFEQKLDELDIENVIITDATLDIEGNVVIDFADDEGDEVSVLFGVDEEGSPYAMVVSEDDEQVIIDLSPLSPPIVDTGMGTFIDLVNLGWINISTIKTLFQAGGVGTDESFEGKDVIDEVVYKKVVRQGKVVRIPVVKRKKRLTAKQKRALAMARRKAHTAQAKRKRMLSLKIRKQKGLD